MAAFAGKTFQKQRSGIWGLTRGDGKPFACDWSYNTMLASSLRPAAALFVFLLAVPNSAATAQSRPGAGGEHKTGTGARSEGAGIIGGRVFAKDTGAPLWQAEVRVTAVDASSARPLQTAFTDTDGKFNIKGLHEGRYVVTAAKEGFLGAPHVGGEGADKAVTLTANSMSASVDLTLPKAGVLEGAVTDDRGNPIPRVVVNAVRVEFVQGRRRLTPVNSGTMTDDRGEARLFGLAPGRYYVVAIAFNRARAARDADGRAIGYAPTYHPTATALSQAQLLVVPVGGTRQFRITLQRARLADIDGVVVDEIGVPRPCGLATASLRNSGNLIPGKGTSVRADGSFRLGGLPPGNYSITCRANTGPDGVPFIATAAVVVDGTDIPNVVLEPKAMVSATGRIVVNDSLAQRLNPESMTVGATLTGDGTNLGGQRPGRARRDWTFTFQSWPGTALVRVGGGGRLHVKAVRYEGRDVTDVGLDFVQGRDLYGIEVELTDRMSTLEGSVTDRAGNAVASYIVVVFSQDRDRWSLPSGRFLAIGRPDQNGAFAIQTLPPGPFYAVALNPSDASDWADPTFLESMTSQASSFVVKDGGSASLTLRLAAVRPR